MHLFAPLDTYHYPPKHNLNFFFFTEVDECTCNILSI